MKSDMEYFSYCRHDLLELVPLEALKILEVGCGTGVTGKVLKEINGRIVVGVDVVESVKSQAEGIYDEFILCDIEKTDIEYPDGYFDCIIYGDVLEHLLDPWKLLEKHSRMLRNGGLIIASIPNLRHYSILKDLAFRGRFEYKERGILDRTHMRFFTLHSIFSLFKGPEYKVVSLVRNVRAGKFLKMINYLFFWGRLKDVLTYQYILKVTYNGNK